ncbi:MAG TPA: hypothetical protein VHV10_17345 [Ktedonobacteraceae bacterium]|jgi:hypothetical protein|nr:hypothetical protein [Ktedonobacteraceae bacterium]
MNIRTVNIKGKQYVDVAERVRLVHAERESFEMIESGPVQVGEMWVWQVAILVNGKRFIGTAEIKFDAPKNSADGTNPVACAETSAVGRALGMAGLGTLESIASADEVVRAIAEQERRQESPRRAQIETAPGEPTAQQLSTIAKLQRQLGEEPSNLEGLGFEDCAALLREYNQRLQEKRKSA